MLDLAVGIHCTGGNMIGTFKPVWDKDDIGVSGTLTNRVYVWLPVHTWHVAYCSISTQEHLTLCAI